MADSPKRKIDANELDAMARARPNGHFLKGSGVSKLIDAIRQLERQVREMTDDAARYRKLREQKWDESNLFVVAGGRANVRLGSDCPRLDRLDAAVDALPTPPAAAYTDSERHPMGAMRQGDWIVIPISLTTLHYTAEGHPELEYYNKRDHSFTRPVVTDINQLAQEIVAQLNTEAEDGQTLITKAFDRAIVMAVENGCEGIEVDEEAAKLRAAQAGATPCP